MEPRMGMTDDELQEAVQCELAWDGRVEPASVGVEVKDGIVTLSGTVSSWAKRVAAQQAAHHVRGVLDVANELRVHVPGKSSPSDAEIAAAVRHALEWNEFIPHHLITTTVSNGWVTLEGTLESWLQREEVDSALRDLRGVVGITNDIRVVAPRTLIRKEIEAALERRAHREAQRVDLAIRDGHIVVTGTVQSWPEKEAVLGAIKGTVGVESIEDCLRIAH